MRRFVPRLLARLGAPYRALPDGLLEVEISGPLAEELAGPMARPERLVLAFDPANAERVEGAEWLTPGSARFREWMELVRRRGRVARLTALPSAPERLHSGRNVPLGAFSFEPWLSIGFTFTPYAGGEASGQQFDEWIVNLVNGSAFRAGPEQLEREVDARLARTIGERGTLAVAWREGLPPKGSAVVHRRLSMRRAYAIACRAIASRRLRADDAADRPMAESVGPNESVGPAPPDEVRVRPYRAAVLYLPGPPATGSGGQRASSPGSERLYERL